MIAAFVDDVKCRIVWIKDFGISSGLSLYLVRSLNGEAFSLVFYDSAYIWAVGRAEDGSNEQAFHHIKLKKSDGTIYSALYKSAATSTG